MFINKKSPNLRRRIPKIYHSNTVIEELPAVKEEIVVDMEINTKKATKNTSKADNTKKNNIAPTEEEK
jgi:hypothetical protein